MFLVLGTGLTVGMEESVWHRLSGDTQAEVDRLITMKHNVQAVALMRDGAGEPTPGIHECVDLLVERSIALGQPLR